MSTSGECLVLLQLTPMNVAIVQLNRNFAEIFDGRKPIINLMNARLLHINNYTS